MLEVDVAPAKPDGLTTPQATQSDEPPQRVEPVGGDPVQERREVLSGPDGDLLPGAVLLPLLDAFVRPDDRMRSGPPGQFDPAGGVVGDQVVADGGVQRAAQRRLDAVQGRRRQGLSGAGGLFGEFGETWR